MFTVTTSAAALVALVVPLMLVNADGQLGPWPKLALILAGSLAILATALDKFADWHDKEETDRAKRAELSAVTNSLTSLLGLLDSAHDIAFKQGATRASALQDLRIPLIQSARTAPAATDVRATYYPMTRDDDGWRHLCNPKSRGRADEASTQFFERDDPDHPIWKLMSSKDINSLIHSEPDAGLRVDWPTRPYKTFISVPVHADGGVRMGRPAPDAEVVARNLRTVQHLIDTEGLSVIEAAKTVHVWHRPPRPV